MLVEEIEQELSLQGTYRDSMGCCSTDREQLPYTQSSVLPSEFSALALWTSKRCRICFAAVLASIMSTGLTTWLLSFIKKVSPAMPTND